MPRYQVTVEAVIRKTIEVIAPDEYEAQNKAQELFTVEPEGDEYYSQDVLEVEEMEDEREFEPASE